MEVGRNMHENEAEDTFTAASWMQKFGWAGQANITETFTHNLGSK